MGLGIIIFTPAGHPPYYGAKSRQQPYPRHRQTFEPVRTLWLYGREFGVHPLSRAHALHLPADSNARKPITVVTGLPQSLARELCAQLQSALSPWRS